MNECQHHVHYNVCHHLVMVGDSVCECDKWAANTGCYCCFCEKEYDR